jgi:hypothetical protein
VRSGSPVRKLLVLYAGLWALLDLIAVLRASNPSFSSVWGLFASVLFQCLLVWRLSLGSAFAWGFGLFVALGAVAWLFLAAAPLDIAVTFIVVVCLAQAGVLLTPSLRGFVRRPTPPASA